jgi:hypothetical protein
MTPDRSDPKEEDQTGTEQVRVPHDQTDAALDEFLESLSTSRNGLRRFPDLWKNGRDKT